jgi:hypothetical protein
LSPRYQTNDDAAMNLYAAGMGPTQPPSEFLLFQHFIIGLTLKSLYTHLPQTPWYGVLLYIYLFLSSLGIGHALTRLNPRFSVVGLWFVLFGLFYLQVIISPQFTICSGYLAIAGILVLYSTVFRPYASTKLNLGMVAIASGLLIWAGLVRYYSLLLVVSLMAPLYFHLLATRLSRTLRRFLPILFCVVLASGLLNRGQLLYYAHSPGWKQFYSYNDVRADFMDRRKIVWDKNTASLFAQVGWSKNDLAMLVSWFYLDRNVYSFEKLLFISQHAALLPPQGTDWEKVFADLKECFLSYRGLATLLLCVLLVARRPRITQGFAIFALLWCLIVFAGISIVERHLPLRVCLVLLFGFCITELVLWCQTRRGQQRGHFSNMTARSGRTVVAGLLLVFYLALCWIAVRTVIEFDGIYRKLDKKMRSDLARLRPRPNQLFVTWDGDFPFQEFQLPLMAKPLAINMQLLGLGVGNHEPFVQNRLKAFKIDDLYQAFYTRTDIFLICRDPEKKLLIQYIKEHYQTNVEFKTVFKGVTFAVSRVQRLSEF